MQILELASQTSPAPGSRVPGALPNDPDRTSASHVTQLAGRVGRIRHGGCSSHWGFQRSQGQHRGDRLPTFFESLEHKSGFNKRAEQSRQGHVRCSNLVPKATRPSMMPSSSGYRDSRDGRYGLRVSAIGEPTAKAWVNPDVDEAATRSHNSPCLPEDGGIIRHIGVNHYGNHTCKRSIAKRQAIAIGLRDWKPGASMSQHPGRDVNAEGRPAQTMNPSSMCSRTTTDLEDAPSP